jgi:hypothetical protein
MKLIKSAALLYIVLFITSITSAVLALTIFSYANVFFFGISGIFLLLALHGLFFGTWYVEEIAVDPESFEIFIAKNLKIIKRLSDGFAWVFRFEHEKLDLESWDKYYVLSYYNFFKKFKFWRWDLYTQSKRAKRN